MKYIIACISVFSSVFSFAFSAQAQCTIPDSLAQCRCDNKSVRPDEVFPFKTIGSSKVRSGMLILCPRRCLDQLFFCDGNGWRRFPLPKKTYDLFIKTHTGGYCYLRINKGKWYKLIYDTGEFTETSKKITGHDCSGNIEE
jgi:hypothetical protein